MRYSLKRSSEVLQKGCSFLSVVQPSRKWLSRLSNIQRFHYPPVITSQGIHYPPVHHHQVLASLYKINVYDVFNYCQSLCSVISCNFPVTPLSGFSDGGQYPLKCSKIYTVYIFLLRRTIIVLLVQYLAVTMGI